MIYLYIITAKGFEKKTLHAADQVMSHLNNRTDVLGFRCVQVPSPKRKKVEEL